MPPNRVRSRPDVSNEYDLTRRQFLEHLSVVGAYVAVPRLISANNRDLDEAEQFERRFINLHNQFDFTVKLVGFGPAIAGKRPTRPSSVIVLKLGTQLVGEQAIYEEDKGLEPEAESEWLNQGKRLYGKKGAPSQLAFHGFPAGSHLLENYTVSDVLELCASTIASGLKVDSRATRMPSKFRRPGDPFEPIAADHTVLGNVYGLEASPSEYARFDFRRVFSRRHPTGSGIELGSMCLIGEDVLRLVHPYLESDPLSTNETAASNKKDLSITPKQRKALAAQFLYEEDRNSLFEPARLSRLIFTPGGGYMTAKARWTWEQACHPQVSEPGFAAISEWLHTSTLGRIVEEVVVEPGVWCPCGHKCRIIYTTTRVFHKLTIRNDEIIVSYLKKVANLKFNEHRINYVERLTAHIDKPDGSEPAKALRALNLREIIVAPNEQGTYKSPPLDHESRDRLPVKQLPLDTPQEKRNIPRWLRVGGKHLRVPAIIVDADGIPHETELAGVFVPCRSAFDSVILNATAGLLDSEPAVHRCYFNSAPIAIVPTLLEDEKEEEKRHSRPVLDIDLGMFVQEADPSKTQDPLSFSTPTVRTFQVALPEIGAIVASREPVVGQPPAGPANTENPIGELRKLVSRPVNEFFLVLNSINRYRSLYNELVKQYIVLFPAKTSEEAEKKAAEAEKFVTERIEKLETQLKAKLAHLQEKIRSDNLCNLVGTLVQAKLVWLDQTTVSELRKLEEGLAAAGESNFVGVDRLIGECQAELDKYTSLVQGAVGQIDQGFATLNTFRERYGGRILRPLDRFDYVDKTVVLVLQKLNGRKAEFGAEIATTIGLLFDDAGKSATTALKWLKDIVAAQTTPLSDFLKKVNEPLTPPPPPAPQDIPLQVWTAEFRARLRTLEEQARVAEEVLPSDLKVALDAFIVCCKTIFDTVDRELKTLFELSNELARLSTNIRAIPSRLPTQPPPMPASVKQAYEDLNAAINDVQNRHVDKLRDWSKEVDAKSKALLDEIIANHADQNLQKIRDRLVSYTNEVAAAVQPVRTHVEGTVLQYSTSARTLLGSLAIVYREELSGVVNTVNGVLAEVDRTLKAEVQDKALAVVSKVQQEVCRSLTEFVGDNQGALLAFVEPWRFQAWVDATAGAWQRAEERVQQRLQRTAADVLLRLAVVQGPAQEILDKAKETAAKAKEEAQQRIKDLENQAEQMARDATQKARAELTEAWIEAKANAGEVWARFKETIGAEFDPARGGGLAVPGFNFAGLSRSTGIVSSISGDLGPLTEGTFDPADYFPETKLLGAISIRQIAKRVTAATGTDHIPKPKRVELSGKEVQLRLDWNTTELQPFLIFEPQPECRLDIKSVVTQKIDGSAPPSVAVNAALSQFDLNIAGCVIVQFHSVTVDRAADGNVDVNVDFKDIQFAGQLSFFEAFNQVLRSILGDGFVLDRPKPDQLRIGYQIIVPPFSAGAFSISNVTLAAFLILSLKNDPLIFRFQFADRFKPFNANAALLGGGGFFALELDPTQGRPIRLLEFSIEAGACFAISVAGLLEAAASVMIGIYVRIASASAVAEGFLRISGTFTIFGFVRVTLLFYLGMGYRSDGVLYGVCIVEIEVKVFFLKRKKMFTAEKTMHKRGGSVAGLPAAVLYASLEDAEEPYPHSEDFEDFMNLNQYKTYRFAFVGVR